MPAIRRGWRLAQAVLVGLGVGVEMEGDQRPLLGSYARTGRLFVLALPLLITMGWRPLSSMDRAPDFGSGGCEFESCSGYFLSIPPA